MSIVSVIIRNPISGDEMRPFVPSTIISVEDISFDICTDACSVALGQINRDPEQRCNVAYLPVSNTIEITCDDERGDVYAIEVQLRGHLANAENGSDIVVHDYTIGQTVHEQINDRERLADC